MKDKIKLIISLLKEKESVAYEILQKYHFNIIFGLVG